MGDNDFAHYLEHHERTHPDKPALSERDYWKARYRAAELNPQGRCC
ncbi:YbdD/YjiX family protein [Mycobacterium sp. OTB74]